MESSLEVRRLPVLRIALLALLLALIVAFVLSGAHRQISLEGLQDTVRSAGPLGVLVFLLAFTALHPLHVSSHLFIVGASLLWSPYLAFALAWVGSMTSTHLSFGLARWAGRDAVLPRLPARVRALEERLADAGVRSVILLKLVFFTTPALQFALGISRLPLRTFAIGTAIGNAPIIAIDIAMGTAVLAWLS